MTKNSLVSIGLVISFVIGAFWGGYELGRIKTDISSVKGDLQEIRNDLKEIKIDVRNLGKMSQ